MAIAATGSTSQMKEKNIAPVPSAEEPTTGGGNPRFISARPGRPLDAWAILGGMSHRAILRRLTAAAAVLGAILIVWAGVVPAEPARFRIQPEASDVSFKATSRLMDADGKFSRFTGEAILDPKDPATARITLSIEPASIDTGIGMRDKHLRSADFLDVARFPTVTFESQRVEMAGRRATVTGRLTLHGVTKEIVVPLDVQLSETALVATGEFLLNRGDYGINYSSFLNPIGNTIRVTFTFRARAS
jgi:polyisoprenoid-binding protein YceI